MIVKMILSLFLTIASIIINTIIPILPDDSIHINLMDLIETVLRFTNQGVNFMYFIFGDILLIIVPIVITLVVVKYTVIPILQLVRSKFINSNV